MAGQWDGKITGDTTSRIARKLLRAKKINTDLLEKYKPVLCGSVPPSVRDSRLLMDSHGDVTVYYAPFEFINHQARVALVGITPGPTQMANANNAARSALLAGESFETAMRLAKETGAFSGEPLRSNLVKQLNHWGIHKWLGLDDSNALFGVAKNLVQTTSLLRYPVFVGGADYRGTPLMTKNSVLRRQLITYFVKEVQHLSNAIFLPLGPAVQKTISALVTEGVLDGSRVLNGLLHPSGNCTYRINYLVGNRSGPVPHATNPAPYDQGRLAFADRFQGG